jgi:hypothetical protein
MVPITITVITTILAITAIPIILAITAIPTILAVTLLPTILAITGAGAIDIPTGATDGFRSSPAKGEGGLVHSPEDVSALPDPDAPR